MSLTHTFIRNVKPASPPRKYFDGEGLFLYVPPNGSKLWRMSYRLMVKLSYSASANTGSTSKTGAKDFGEAIPMRFSPAYPQRTRTRKR